MKDASPGWTERLDQNHSLGPDHKSFTQFGPLCYEFSINLAETIIQNKGDLKKDVGSATHPLPSKLSHTGEKGIRGESIQHQFSSHEDAEGDGGLNGASAHF